MICAHSSRVDAADSPCASCMIASGAFDAARVKRVVRPVYAPPVVVESDDDLLTSREVAGMLRLDLKNFTNLYARLIPCASRKQGSRYMFRRADVRAYLASREAHNTSIAAPGAASTVAAHTPGVAINSIDGGES